MSVVNLDHLIGEALGEPKQVELRGEVYELPAECPVLVVYYWDAGDYLKAIDLLFGDQAGEVGPLVTESFMLGLLREVYGAAGESSASSTSSKSTGKPARPTSKPSIDSTSGPSVSDGTLGVLEGSSV